MYDKVQVDSKVPQLEKELEKTQLMWVDMAKEHLALVAEVKRVPKLEALVTTLQKAISELHGSHKAEIETLCGMRAKIERLRGLH